MNIELLNVKITIQRNAIVTDNIGNHTNAWTDYYTCHATVSGESGSEDTAAGTVVDHSDVDFTIRWCDKVKTVTTDEYRVMFGGEIYNIIGIDHMSYKKKCIKLRCKKVRR